MARFVCSSVVGMHKNIVVDNHTAEINSKLSVEKDGSYTDNDSFIHERL